jgi:adenylylsulfate kinase-like enzyme
MATKSSRSSSSSGKLAAVRGKTTRATIINMLIKKNGHTVSIDSIKSELTKKLGFTKEKASKRVKAKIPQVGQWAKQHGKKLVVKSDGLKLVA